MRENQEELYEKLIAYIREHQKEFYRLAYSYTKNPENAMDVVQNAICTSLEKYQTLKDPNAMKSWFYRILVNESLMFLRRHKREILFYEGQEVSTNDTYFEEDRQLYQNIQKLPERLRTVILLHYFEKLTLKEVSKITNTNLSTIKSRLYKALKLLKIELEKEEYEYENI